jgi:hypothetical protein
VAYQVTATQGANAVNGTLLRIKVLLGAASATAQTGATKIADTTNTPFYDQSITTTQTGSAVYGAMADGNTAFSMTADARTTLLDNFSDATQGCQYATFKATSLTGTPGATTLGATSPGAGEHGTWAAAEILAAGTITEDASAPAVATTTAATSVQSAAFSPPPGSLLVALVAHCSSAAGAITITNNGGTLTWRQLAYESTAGGTGAGVWVAQVPSGAVDPRPLPPLPLLRQLLAHRIGGTQPAQATNAQAGCATATASAYSPIFQRYITGLGGTGAGYFVDQTGTPRMVIGDAVWGLPGNVGRWSSGAWQSDYDTYFATRAAQGFTVAYCKPMGTTQNLGINDDGRTFDGLFPFQGGSLANPSTGLTASYWARIDYMLQSAQSRGITIFLNAIGYDSDFETSGPLAGKSASEFQSYGAALGARYAATPNLIWVVADDYFGGADAKIDGFLTGLRGAGDTHPITIENYPETTSRQDIPGASATAWGAANAQYNFCYSYNVTYYAVEKAYLEASPIPVITGDGYFYQGGSSYAGGTGAFAYDHAIRQDAWHSLSSGARGIIHGDEATWQWQSGAQASAASAWYHSNNVGNIRTLIESLANWYMLIPDTSSQLVTAGRGTHASGFSSGGGGGQYEVAFTDSYVTASRTAAGDLAVIYLSHATTITIDQSKMTAGYLAYWVDPITGVKTLTTSGSSYNSGSQGSNSQGDADWVLVLIANTAVNASAGNAAGSAVSEPPSVSVAVSAGLASASGASPSASARVAPAGGLASASGVSESPAVSIASSGGNASAGGVGEPPGASLSVAAANASAAGVSETPALSLKASAPNASAAGVSEPPALAVSPNAGNATAAGIGEAPAISILVSAGLASASATGEDPTISTSGATHAPAGNASAAGVAETASVSVSVAAGLASASGSAAQVALNVAPAGGLASGTGVSQTPAIPVRPSAGTGSAVAVAESVSISLLVPAGLASGAGVAEQVSAGTGRVVPAGVASASGAAPSVSLTVVARPAAAVATGSAGQPSIPRQLIRGSVSAGVVVTGPSVKAGFTSVASATVVAGNVAGDAGAQEGKV